MRPVLVDLGPLQVNSFGVMAALAFLAAAVVAGAELERRGHSRADAWPLTIAGAIGGLIGAKLYFLVEHPDRIADAGAWLSGEGFTWYGGVLGGTAAVLLVASRRGLTPAVTAASLVPALALGYAIGRIGCQLAGDGTARHRAPRPSSATHSPGGARARVLSAPYPHDRARCRRCCVVSGERAAVAIGVRVTAGKRSAAASSRRAPVRVSLRACRPARPAASR